MLLPLDPPSGSLRLLGGEAWAPRRRSCPEGTGGVAGRPSAPESPGPGQPPGRRRSLPAGLPRPARPHRGWPAGARSGRPTPRSGQRGSSARLCGSQSWGSAPRGPLAASSGSTPVGGELPPRSHPLCRPALHGCCGCQVVADGMPPQRVRGHGQAILVRASQQPPGPVPSRDPRGVGSSGPDAPDPLRGEGGLGVHSAAAPPAPLGTLRELAALQSHPHMALDLQRRPARRERREKTVRIPRSPV